MPLQKQSNQMAAVRQCLFLPHDNLQIQPPRADRAFKIPRSFDGVVISDGKGMQPHRLGRLDQRIKPNQAVFGKDGVAMEFYVDGARRHGLRMVG